MRIAVIGVPWNSSGGQEGEAQAPAVLRAAGLLTELARHVDAVDYGDVLFDVPSSERDPTTGIIAPGALARMTLATRAAVARAFADWRVPLLIGGDCAFLLGALAAARDDGGRPPGLLLVDGHEDAYPPAASTTGEAADMEIGLALGWHLPVGVPDLTGHLPVLEPEHVVVLGARDAATLAEEGVPSITDRVVVLDDEAVEAAGAGAIATRWVERFRNDPGRFWLHLDLDALSTAAMPAVSYRQPGGLAWDAFDRIAEAALGHPALVGVSLADYNPDLADGEADGEAGGGAAAARVIRFAGEAFARHADHPGTG